MMLKIRILAVSSPMLTGLRLKCEDEYKCRDGGWNDRAHGLC